MKNIVRYNPPHEPNQPYTVEVCPSCGEFREPRYVHICKAWNSQPQTLAEDERVVPPKPFKIRSDDLLSAIEKYCDIQGNISFETIYYIVKELGRDKRKN